MCQNSSKVTGVPAGFHDLDEKTSGFQKSDLIIIAGRPGMGKTALALSIGKQRNGPTDTIKLSYFGEYTRFENYAEMGGY